MLLKIIFIVLRFLSYYIFYSIMLQQILFFEKLMWLQVEREMETKKLTKKEERRGVYGDRYE